MGKSDMLFEPPALPCIRNVPKWSNPGGGCLQGSAGGWWGSAMCYGSHDVTSSLLHFVPVMAVFIS